MKRQRYRWRTVVAGIGGSAQRSGGRAGLHKRGRDRIVIGCANSIVHLPLGIRRIGDKDPVDRACVRQDMRRSGWMPGASDCVAEAGVAESPRCLAAAGVEVEIARDHETRPVDVPAAVRKDLVQLPDSKIVGASALQMKIVGHHLASVDSCFRYEGNPTAEPALKSREIRHIPMRLPERGLVTETNNPGFRERPWGERGHAVKGWPVGASLARSE